MYNLQDLTTLVTHITHQHLAHEALYTALIPVCSSTSHMRMLTTPPKIAMFPYSINLLTHSTKEQLEFECIQPFVHVQLVPIHLIKEDSSISLKF